MLDDGELPEALVERVATMEAILVACATGDSSDNRIYEHLRREFMQDEGIRSALPAFVRTCRNLDSFWPFIKSEAPTYAERRRKIGMVSTPLVDMLEGSS